MRRIGVAGEIFNQNLGDQAIHDCLTFLLKKRIPGIETVALDTSGRLNSTINSTRLGLNQRIALLQGRTRFRIPFYLLNLLYQTIKYPYRRANSWGPVLQSVDVLVIGGGQLLMDDALSFPMKLSGLTNIAASHEIPFHISACGVGKNWSFLATAAFRKMLAKAATITLRDELSRERFNRLLPSLKPAVTFDPAIWAGEVYPLEKVNPGNKVIGLGVIHPDEANLHLPAEMRRSEEKWLEAWLSVIRPLLNRNFSLHLFTTGSLADSVFAGDLFARIQQQGWSNVSLTDRPQRPAALLTILQNCTLVAAARLHASILSNALGITTIGLGWDQKVGAYYRMTDREDAYFEIMDLFLNPQEIARACAVRAGEPLSKTDLSLWKDRAFSNARIIAEAY